MSNNLKSIQLHVSVSLYNPGKGTLEPAKIGLENALFDCIQNQVDAQILRKLQPGDAIRAIEKKIDIRPAYGKQKSLSPKELQAVQQAIKDFFNGYNAQLKRQRLEKTTIDPSRLLIEIRAAHSPLPQAFDIAQAAKTHYPLLAEEIEEEAIHFNHLLLQHELSTKFSSTRPEQIASLLTEIQKRKKNLQRLMGCAQTTLWAEKYRFDHVSFLGDGAVKDVFGDNRFAYYITKKSWFSWITHFHEAEIREEVETAKRISSKIIEVELVHFLIEKGIPESSAKEMVSTLQSVFTQAELLEAIEKGTLENKLFRKKIQGTMKLKIPVWPKKIKHFFSLFSDKLKKIVSGAKNLAVDLEELPKGFGIDKQYTVSAPKAYANLEKEIVTGGNDFGTKIHYASGFLNGMQELQKAGWVHGDIKPENCLVYRSKDGLKTVKISDFGKARCLKENEKRMYFGNSRFCPPEAKLSRKGEVYGAAMTVIRILEEGLLKEDDMLIQPSETSNVKPLKKRRGIERFVIASKAMPQSEAAAGLIGKFKAYSPRIQTLFVEKKIDLKAEKEMYGYIDALTQELSHAYGLKSFKTESLNCLLKEMTHSDPKLRPSMEEASRRFNEIWVDFL